jgi:polar amino acid transport system substrate-binding protein
VRVPTLRLWLFAVLLFPVLGAAAAKLRVCTDVHPHAPYLMPDGSGSAGLLVAAAAREAGLELEFYSAPLARCRAEIGLNLVHAFPITPYAPDLAAIADYPMHGGAPDPARATMRARVLLYRRRGAAVTWDGARIGALARPVLVPSGSVMIPLFLKALGVPMDQNGQSMEINFVKLMAGRGEALAGIEDEGERLLRQPRFAGKIEALPQPLFEQTYYLAVAKDFHARNGPAVEAMWDAIGRLNQSAKALKK